MGSRLARSYANPKVQSSNPGLDRLRIFSVKTRLSTLGTVRICSPVDWTSKAYLATIIARNTFFFALLTLKIRRLYSAKLTAIADAPAGAITPYSWRRRSPTKSALCACSLTGCVTQRYANNNRNYLIANDAYQTVHVFPIHNYTCQMTTAPRMNILQTRWLVSYIISRSNATWPASRQSVMSKLVHDWPVSDAAQARPEPEAEGRGWASRQSVMSKLVHDCLRTEPEPRTSWASTGRPSPKPRARHRHNCFEVDNAQLILDLN